MDEIQWGFIVIVYVIYEFYLDFTFFTILACAIIFQKILFVWILKFEQDY